MKAGSSITQRKHKKIVSKKKKKKKPVRQRQAQIRKLAQKRDRLSQEINRISLESNDAVEVMIAIADSGGDLELSAQERYALRSTGIIGGKLRTLLAKAATKKQLEGVLGNFDETEEDKWAEAMAEFDTDVAGNTAHQNFLDNNHKHSMRRQND